MDIVISGAAAGHTLVDIVVADPTRRDLVERAARQDLIAATDAERRKETRYRDRAPKFVPFALEKSALQPAVESPPPSSTAWPAARISSPNLRSPSKVSNVAAAAVAAAAAAGVGTGGLVAEVEPRPDFALWTTEDDLQLLDAMESGAAMEALAKGALQFSRRFTVKELRARWRALLYDPVIGPRAAAQIVRSEPKDVAHPGKHTGRHGYSGGRKRRAQESNMVRAEFHRRQRMRAMEAMGGVGMDNLLCHGGNGEQAEMLNYEGLGDEMGDEAFLRHNYEVLEGLEACEKLELGGVDDMEAEDPAFSHMVHLLAAGGFDALGKDLPGSFLEGAGRDEDLDEFVDGAEVGGSHREEYRQNSENVVPSVPPPPSDGMGREGLGGGGAADSALTRPVKEEEDSAMYYAYDSVLGGAGMGAALSLAPEERQEGVAAWTAGIPLPHAESTSALPPPGSMATGPKKSDVNSTSLSRLADVQPMTAMLGGGANGVTPAVAEVPTASHGDDAEGTAMSSEEELSFSDMEAMILEMDLESNGKEEGQSARAGEEEGEEEEEEGVELGVGSGWRLHGGVVLAGGGWGQLARVCTVPGSVPCYDWSRAWRQPLRGRWWRGGRWPCSMGSISGST